MERPTETLDPPLRSFAYDAPVRPLLFESSQWWNKTSTGGSNCTPKPNSPPLSVFSLGESAPLANSFSARSNEEQRSYPFGSGCAALLAARLLLSLRFVRWHSRLFATEAIAFRMTTTSKNKGERLTVQDESIVPAACTATGLVCRWFSTRQPCNVFSTFRLVVWPNERLAAYLHLPFSTSHPCSSSFFYSER